MYIDNKCKRPIEIVLKDIEDLLINNGYGRLRSIKFEVNYGLESQTLSFDNIAN